VDFPTSGVDFPTVQSKNLSKKAISAQQYRSFPLLSFPLLFLLLFASGSLYGGFLVLNSTLFLLVLHFSSSFLTWFLLYEISVLTVISCLSVEGRSFRRVFALSTMIFLGFVGAGIVAGILNSAFASIASPFAVSTALLAVVVLKIPTFPFSFWLPEAHVEAS
jgi:NADH:ubiquinone oxidoreductase subunit 4 (subunit M)